MNSTAHILIVDDEPEIANSLAEYLAKKGGYTVTKAYGGGEALSLLQDAAGSPAETVDLVVLDRRMPGVSGLEVLEKMRQDPTLKYTRVVMLTGASGSQEKVEALSSGADDYITKPYYPEELLARVESTLRTQRLEKRLQQQSQQLAALNRVSNAITTTLDISHIPEAAASGTCQVLGTRIAALYMWDQQAGVLRCRAVAREGKKVAPKDCETTPAGEGAIGTAYAEQRTICVNEPEGNDHYRREFDAASELPIENLLATPLVVRGRSIGVLSTANRREGPFSNVDVDLIASLASAVSRAVENASLFQNVKARQQALQESHNRLQAVINGILHPIYTIDDNWRLVAVNRQKAEEADSSSERLVGRICYRAFYGLNRPCEHCLAAETLTEKAPRQWSVRQVGADHLPQEWDVHAYPLPGTQPKDPSAVVVWQDRTEERRLENSLMQAGKLAAIGQLAAGVAHEINNPLTAINANAQMLKMVIPADDDMYEAVELIARAGDRASNVVRGLLDFARQNQYSFEPGDVNRSILQAQRMLTYQFKSADIDVVRDLDEDLPEVEASWEHLKTVWLNLLINARDAVLALPSGRRIAVETRMASSGDHVQVLVTDNGKGISPAEAEHIFEPFYTTKDPGQGTGLGLATSQRIVQQHGGSMEVVSEAEDGTTFIVRLPIRRVKAQEGT